MQYIRDINGLEVKAEYSGESIEQIFLPLLKNLTNLQKTLNRRIVVMLAAPPAAGKSTLVNFLQYLSEITPDITKEHIGELPAVSFRNHAGHHTHHSYRNGRISPLSGLSADTYHSQRR